MGEAVPIPTSVIPTVPIPTGAIPTSAISASTPVQKPPGLHISAVNFIHYSTQNLARNSRHSVRHSRRAGP